MASVCTRIITGELPGRSVWSDERIGTAVRARGHDDHAG